MHSYESTLVDENVVTPQTTKMKFKTETTVPKLGVMLVGLGGNNGCTSVAGILANKLNLTWETKEGTSKPNYWGSVMMASTAKVGNDKFGNSVFTPMQNMLPMVHPNDFVMSGWDISAMNLGDAMKRSQVLDINLQQVSINKKLLNISVTHTNTFNTNRNSTPTWLESNPSPPCTSPTSLRRTSPTGPTMF